MTLNYLHYLIYIKIIKFKIKALKKCFKYKTIFIQMYDCKNESHSKRNRNVVEK